MSELLFLLIGGLVGCFVGIRIGWNSRERAAKKFVANYLTEMYQDVEKNTINIQITRVNDLFLVHNESTGEFLTQGTTHEEISKNLKERFPQKTFLATPANIKEIGYPLNDTV